MCVDLYLCVLVFHCCWIVSSIDYVCVLGPACVTVHIFLKKIFSVKCVFVYLPLSSPMNLCMCARWAALPQNGFLCWICVSLLCFSLLKERVFVRTCPCVFPKCCPHHCLFVCESASQVHDMYYFCWFTTVVTWVPPCCGSPCCVCMCACVCVSVWMRVSPRMCLPLLLCSKSCVHVCVCAWGSIHVSPPPVALSVLCLSVCVCVCAQVCVFYLNVREYVNACTGSCTYNSLCLCVCVSVHHPRISRL